MGARLLPPRGRSGLRGLPCGCIAGELAGAKAPTAENSCINCYTLINRIIKSDFGALERSRLQVSPRRREGSLSGRPSRARLLSGHRCGLLLLTQHTQVCCFSFNIHFVSIALERSRTSTTLRPLAPEASASANSATRANTFLLTSLYALSFCTNDSNPRNDQMRKLTVCHQQYLAHRARVHNCMWDYREISQVIHHE